MADAPRILVIEDDAGIRRLVRTGLELEGFAVIEAATLAQARSVQTERVAGVVLDRQLPDGDGLDIYDELRERYDGTVVVMHSADAVPASYAQVAKGDVSALVEAFHFLVQPTMVVEGAPAVARAAAGQIADAWAELCLWDPELPPDSRPPIPDSVVGAVTSALERPQPLGWGLDPALEPVAEAYFLNHDAVDIAVAQLVCLREVFERLVVDELPQVEQLEASRRLTMIVQRLMTVVVRAGVAQLESDAFVDAVTGLGNRYAFDVDLQREMARARRHARPLTVVRVRVDAVDNAPEGEDDLRRVARALLAVAGSEVHAYRLGWTDFALILPDVVPVDDGFVLGPLRRAAIDAVAIAMATYPEDALGALGELAGQRLPGNSRESVPDTLDG
jgi:GGDEF domain-containing protein/ActR/RegA family two-component response regulator